MLVLSFSSRIQILLVLLDFLNSISCQLIANNPYVIEAVPSRPQAALQATLFTSGFPALEDNLILKDQGSEGRSSGHPLESGEQLAYSRHKDEDVEGKQEMCHQWSPRPDPKPSQ